LLETYDTQNDRFVIAPCSWYRVATELFILI
jgi:hypothetical protein